MLLEEIVPQMSKMYLTRTIDSFLKDVRINDEEEMREVILKNVEEFQNQERVKSNLDFSNDSRDTGVLNEMILHCLMETPNYLLEEADLFKNVEELMLEIVEQSRDEQLIKNIPEDARRIYTAVLEAAWKKDDELNPYEMNILNVLAKELELSKKEHYLLESRIGRFPQKGNKLHSTRQVELTLRDLQNRGIILRFKSTDTFYVIPKEIARTVRFMLGGELRKEAYELLLQSLHNSQLRQILGHFDLFVSGTKEARIERIMTHDILPSQALNVLATSDLTEVLRSLEGARVSGTKEEKIINIINFYEDLTIHVSDPTDERARYCDFFEDLAARDYQTLRANQVISKDVEIENYFEEATRYLFEAKLRIPLMEMKGSQRADGRIKFNATECILWDNKSTEQPYNFPDNHFEQFLGYMRSEEMRVTLFLVIVSDYTPQAIAQAQKLKAFSGEDSDVALIRAADLKYVADNWTSFSKMREPEFNLEVFNLTGELTRDLLVSRMEWMLDVQ